MNYGDPKVSLSNLSGGSPCETIDISYVLNHENDESDEDDEDYEDYENKEDSNTDQRSNEYIIDYNSYLYGNEKGLQLTKRDTANLNIANYNKTDFNNNDNKELTELDLLWYFILKSISMKSLLNTSFDKYRWYTARSLGLQSNHTYALLQAVEIKYGKKGKKERLIKLRNPNGDEYSWKGEWSVYSGKWRHLTEQTKRNYNIACDQSIGEFYISLKDYARYFNVLDVAHINLNSFYDFEIFEAKSYEWEIINFYDIWMEKINAGNSNEFYWSNAQYLIQIYENTNEPNKLTPIIVTLMQPYRVYRRYENNGKYNNTFAPIRFSIYSVKSNKYRIDENILNKRLFKKQELKLYDSSCCYIDQQEVTKKLYLPKGYYVILPSTFTTKKNINYYIRIFYQQFTAYFLSNLIFK
jgi:hypothetical protein